MKTELNNTIPMRSPVTLRTVAFAWLLLLSVSARATVINVSNNVDNPAQYKEVDEAIAAASEGDTIYVHGSPDSYKTFTVNKRLVLIGAGYNSSNQFGLASKVSSIVLAHDLISDSSGSVITGFNVASSISTNSSSVIVNNITIYRCRLGQVYIYVGDGWIFYNNILNYIGGYGASSTNVVIQNNIIDGSISGFSATSVLVDHNLFIGGSNLSSIKYAVITNNIFVRSSGNIMNSVEFCTFSNNLSLAATISTIAPTNSFLSNNNTGSGNLVGSNPNFVTASSSSDTYDPAVDYRLKPASAGHNAATDGTDLGIYGGARPFPSGGASGSGFDTSALPSIPQVTEVNIQNATVQPGGSLNVNVKAKVNN
jgi:hypothetical protein